MRVLAIHPGTGRHEPPGLERVGTLLQAGDVFADFDGCTLDGRALVAREDFLHAIDAGRLADVRGAFVVAWCDRDGAINLARDPVGERTLYYRRDRPAFATGIGALLDEGDSPALDPIAIARYLTYSYVPGQATLAADVFELRPGEQARFVGDRWRTDPFWRLPPEPEEPGTEAELRDRLRAALETAVARRLPAGDAVGATLSGGIDSSLVVALAARARRQVTSYSISFGEGYRNELEWSSMVANACGCEHEIVTLSPEAVMARFDDTVACLSKPNGDPLTVPNHALFETASARGDVLLNGEGGDPCFGGPKNQPMLLGEVFDSGLYAPVDALARERDYLRAHERCYDELDEALAPSLVEALRDQPLERELTPWLTDPRYRSLVNRLMATNVVFKGAHHILPKVDALSRPFGVLPRSPLFDRDVVELAFAIPPGLKLKGSVEKYLLKESVRDLLPEAIVRRPKSGMLVPVERWFRGPMRDFARERLLDGLAPRGIVRREYLESLVGFRRRGLHPRTGIKIWLLLTLESWLRTHMPDSRI